MNKKNRKIIFFLIIIFTFLIKARFVSALEIHYPTFNIFGQTFSINDTSTLQEYICYFYGLGTNLALVIAVMVIAFGGIHYLISFLKGKFKDEGKDWIKAGVLGLLIIICASLTLSTINPSLATCKLGILPQISFMLSGDGTSSSNGNFRTYKEIPLGILTENLLTRTVPCATSNQLGDPVSTIDRNTGKPTPTGSTNAVTGWGNEVTSAYIDNVQCQTQNIESAQKVAQVVAELSRKIVSLMDQCSCVGKCTSSGGGQAGCNQPTSCPDPSKKCTGSSVGGTYQNPPGGTGDCCPADSGVKDASGNPIPVKQLIEHGPITLSFDVDGTAGSNCPTSGCCVNPKTSTGTTKTFRGLDEFRCDPSKGDTCSGILAIISTQIVPGGTAQYGHVIDLSLWDKLTLWQKLQFYKESINTYSNSTKADLAALALAKNELSQCYLATSYIDLIKTAEITDKKDTVILKNPITAIDQITGEPLTAAKYCTGFSYANSSCFKKCNDICPDSSSWAMSAYQNAGNISCKPGDKGCLDRQAKSLANIYNTRPCLFGNYKDFNDCIGSCQGGCQDTCAKQCNASGNPEGCLDSCYKNNCTDACSQQYLPCSVEFQFCEQHQYTDNSACILNPDNASKCLFGTQNFINCSKNANDPGNNKYCITNAYLCKNGSDQFAGYPDCVNSQDDQFSSSYLFTNPDSQKCATPYGPASQNSVCYNPNRPNAVCQNSCFETQKCPTSSSCPTCPCDQINQNIIFPTPSQSISELSIPDLEQEGTCPDDFDCINGKICDILTGKCIVKPPPVDNSSGNFCSNINSICPSGEVCDTVARRCFTSSYPGSGNFCNNINSICPSGEVCDTVARRCVTSSIAGSGNFCSNINSICPSGEVCDTVARRCFTSSSPGSGNFCNNINSICPSGEGCDTIAQRCVTSSIAGSGNFCVTSLTCPYGEVCDTVIQKCFKSTPTILRGPTTTGSGSGPESGSATDYGKPCTNNSECSGGTVCDPTIQACAAPPNVVNADNPGYINRQIPVSAYQLVGPECNEYSFSQDPLTFYCENQWWNNPEREGTNPLPMGTNRLCSTSNEIPFGQTVDNAENWAKSYIKLLEDIIENDIDPILDQMTKIGKAKDTDPIKNYCGCEARYDNENGGKPVCQTGCTYNEQMVSTPIYGPVPDSGGTTPPSDESYCVTYYALPSGEFSEPVYTVCPSGQECNTTTGTCELINGSGTGTPPNSPTSLLPYNNIFKNNFLLAQSTGTDPGIPPPLMQIGSTEQLQCSCTFAECKINPCIQVKDYLSDLWNNYRDFKIDFADYYTTILSEPRSDILKSLSYSRNKINKCSLVANNFGTNSKVMSCTRVEDELIPPVNNQSITFGGKKYPGYCYGKELGKILPNSMDLTDNWFCCSEQIQ